MENNLFGGLLFDKNNANQMQKLVDAGFKYYVAEDVQDKGTDPWSGMPNSHLNYYAFDNEEDAKEFAAVAKANIFSNEKNTVESLEDLLNHRVQVDKENAERDAKEKAAADKRKEYNNNLPEWRKIRSKVIKVKGEYNQAMAQMNQLKVEYESKLNQLKQLLDAAGIQYSDIESVLSKDFLKK